jgi:hypothetical protein
MSGLKIAETAIQAVRRELPGLITAPGWCMAFAFEAIARAYNTNRWLIYAKLLDKHNADPDRSRWAIDGELAVQRAQWAITTQDLNPAIATHREMLLKLLKPGDLLFSSRRFDEAPISSRTAPDREGHVGIFVGEYEGVQCVAENTRADRGRYFGSKNAMRLTPLEQWDTVTTIARIPQNWRPV